MILSKTSIGLVALVATVGGLAAPAAPAVAAPFAKSAELQAAPFAQEVSWRGRRNTALVAGALGLTALGIAAAAASQPRYGYGGGFYDGYGYGPAYGYRPYAYGGEPYGYMAPRRRAPVYYDPYAGGYEVEVVPRRRHVSPRQPYLHDYGRGFQRGRDPAGNN